MSVIICGSRNWDNQERMERTLIGLLGETPYVIHGAAPGADMMADMIVRGLWDEDAYTIVPFPADWTRHKQAAGPIRNTAMLEHLLTAPKPHCVIAFRKGEISKGTDDMVRQARKAGVDALVYYKR